MRTYTETKIAYTFPELSESAKHIVLQNYAENGLDPEWWDAVYDDFANICELLGVDLARDTRKSAPRHHTIGAPHIHFTGFWSQGGGASFEGHYAYRKGAVKDVMNYAPVDAELHRIAKTLQTCQRKAFYSARATITQSGRYYHSSTMSINVETRLPVSNTIFRECEDTIEHAMRDLAEWLYRCLEDEYEYLTSEEAFEVLAGANGWEFDENGNWI